MRENITEKVLSICLFLIRLHIFFYLKNILDINLISRIFFKIVNNAKIYSMIYIHDSTFQQLDNLFIFDTTVYFLSTHLAVVKLACDLSPECNYIIILIDFLSRFPRSSSSHGVYKMYALAIEFF